MSVLITVIAIVILVFLALFLYRKYAKNESTILHLPLQELGFRHVPGFPIVLSEVVVTLTNLLGRSKEVQQAKAGLSKEYTIKNVTANAYAFAFGKGDSNTKEEAMEALLSEAKKSSDVFYKSETLVKSKLKDEGVPYKLNALEALTSLSLDSPDQFSLSWTTFGNIHRDASQSLLGSWSKTMTDAQEATKQFFPTIAKYGSAYNLLILQKPDKVLIEKYRLEYASYWNNEMDDLYAAGDLYIIDFGIYKMLEAQQSEGFDRFTPATFTWLKRDSVSKTIVPFSVYVSGNHGNNAQFYLAGEASNDAWIYSLQAVKTSVTVYGIWLGHVYHWHLVTASMVMTMFNNIPATHPVYQILAPQSKHIIGFNDVLVLLWKKAAPPTSIITAFQFLELIDVFATDRNFFDDDPKETLGKLGLQQEDFTNVIPWDLYPIVGYLLHIWDIVERYVDKVVDHSFKNDASVKNDSAIQSWIKASGEKNEGNIKGLPPMDNVNNLKRVLTSILYRITAHGISRMDNTANPAMSFVGNFPPCLQSTHIPEQTSKFSTSELMQYLPNTGTIGEMITFYYTFVDSAPYEPIIPLRGIKESLFYGASTQSADNQALIIFREELVAFMHKYNESNRVLDIVANSTQIHQWPMSIET